MRYLQRRDRLRSGSCRDKPPKLRFKPGIFVRKKGVPQLYCVRVIYRLRDNPHEWLFQLEERASLGTPHTDISVACGVLSGDAAGLDACVVLWTPLLSSMDIGAHELCRNMYHYGSSITATNKEMLNDYEVVAAGEVL